MTRHADADPRKSNSRAPTEFGRVLSRIARAPRHVSVTIAIALLVSSALPPPVAAGATPTLFPSWGGWADGSRPRPTYLFTSSMPLAWMRAEARAGINGSGNTPYLNPVFREVTSGTPNVTVGMRPSPGLCAGEVKVWYACTDLVTAYSRWAVSLASNYCWMNGGQYRTCSNNLTFDVWSVINHEFLHVNSLNHHSPTEPWNSVMLTRSPTTTRPTGRTDIRAATTSRG